jgi:hypothetical protein
MFETQVVEKIKKHILYSIIFFSKHIAVYEIMWKNTVEPKRPQMTIWFMHILRWIRKVTDLKPDYVTHCSSTATMVAQTHFNATLHIHYIAFRLCKSDLFYS